MDSVLQVTKFYRKLSRHPVQNSKEVAECAQVVKLRWQINLTECPVG